MLLYSQSLQKKLIKRGMGEGRGCASQGTAFGEELGLNQQKHFVQILCTQKVGAGRKGRPPPPSPRGSESLFDECNGSQRANVRDTDDIDIQFDEQP